MSDYTQTMRRKAASLKSIALFGGLRVDLMILSFILLLIAALFEGFSFGLLVPFLKQAAGMGAYEGWKNIPVVGDVLKHLHFDRISHRIDLILGIIVAAVLIRQVTSYISQVLFFSATLMYEAKLRIAGYERLLNYGCLFFDNIKKGELHNTLMRFTQEISEMMRQIFGLCQNAFFSVMYIIVLFNVSLPLSLTALAIAPFFYLLLKSLFKLIHHLYNKILQQEQKSHGLSFDVFSNIKLVKAMGREIFEADVFRGQERGRARDSVLAYSLWLLIGPLQEILMTAGIATMVWIAFNYFFKDDPSFLIKLIVSLLLFRRTVGAMNSVFSNYPQVVRRFPFVREYRELMEPSDKGMIISGSRDLATLHKGIEYRKVGMGYANNDRVLKNVSCFIPAGSFTAIVGPSGAGKSTFAELLPRFYEHQEGAVLIDDVFIRDYDIHKLRAAIGFVSQDTLVLNDTIFNNILYAKPDASQEDVHLAAEKSKVADFTRNLPEGLNTVIGDKGVKLSGGELQRLSIARVMLRKPKILILDEATSALDSVSEKIIQEALDELSQGRTTIAIAHRLSTIRHADQILVMKDGAIVESGKLDELLSCQGVFAQYWQAQQFQ